MIEDHNVTFEGTSMRCGERWERIEIDSAIFGLAYRELRGFSNGFDNLACDPNVEWKTEKSESIEFYELTRPKSRQQKNERLNPWSSSPQYPFLAQCRSSHVSLLVLTLMVLKEYLRHLTIAADCRTRGETVRDQRSGIMRPQSFPRTGTSIFEFECWAGLRPIISQATVRDIR